MSYTLIDLNYIKEDSTSILFTKNSKEYNDYITWCNNGGVPTVENTGMYQAIPGKHKDKVCYFCKFKTEGVNSRVKNLDENLKRKRGSLIRQLCQEVLGYITGKNDQSTMTSQDVDSFITAHGVVMQLLQNNRHNSAKAVIDQITPDAFVTSVDLIAVNKIYDVYLPEINSTI